MTVMNNTKDIVKYIEVATKYAEIAYRLLLVSDGHTKEDKQEINNAGNLLQEYADDLEVK